MEIMEFQYKSIIDQALAEDLAMGDITTDLLIGYDRMGTGYIKSKAKGILSGTGIAQSVFLRMDDSIDFHPFMQDGGELSEDDKIARIRGRLVNILKAERVALNFMQHLSGIATQTSMFVNAVRGLPVKICDTRKTLPGLRLLEKKAVRDGGGINHRLNLAESILIKNNHLKALIGHGFGLEDVILKAKQQSSLLKKIVEVEVETIEDAVIAAEAGADIIMLDNMICKEMAEAVKSVNRRAITEASGGVNLDNVVEIAMTGIDIISIGALTHSAGALDINLTLE